jgi:hypothetical protein
MATADQLEREAKKKATEQAALAKLWDSTSATQATGNVYTPKPAQTQKKKDKPWEQMTPAEQQAALAKVDWAGLGKLTGTTPAEEVPKTTMPIAQQPVSNVQATSDMYAQALAELQRQYGTSQGNINAAIERLKADPYNTANAYANLQVSAPTVAADPLAAYMAAAGLSGGQSAAAQQLAQAESDAYQRAMQNVANVMSTSQQQANLSRLADIGLIETGAAQDLESNLNMLRLGMERERLGALTGLQQQNLQNDLTMRNAIASQISNIFSGQDVAPESILKLIEQALAKMNTSRWTDMPLPSDVVRIQPIGTPTGLVPGV